jgi:hypothetical protein
VTDDQWLAVLIDFRAVLRGRMSMALDLPPPDCIYHPARFLSRTEKRGAS